MIKGGQARELDQFFTKPEIASKCLLALKSSLKCNLEDFNFIVEPSCGNGAFSNLLPVTKTISMDIDAIDENNRYDFLNVNIPFPDNSFILTIGNPPYGKNSSLAVKFFNKAASYSNIIAFIVPKTFSKISLQNKLDLKFHCLLRWELEENSFIFEDKSYNVNCEFQIWTKADCFHLFNCSTPTTTIRLINNRTGTTDDFYFVKSEDNPDIQIQRVGKSAGRISTNKNEMKTSDNYFYIKVTDSNKIQEVLSNLLSLNLENRPEKHSTSSFPSLSKTELCNLYNQI
jgi:predicted RNA methylase